MPYYAVANGKTPGVYNSWDECKANVNGYSGASYKKFSSQAECQSFINARSSGGGGSARSSGGGSGGGSYGYGGSSSGSNYRSTGNNGHYGQGSFRENRDGFVDVYTDGSCANNGQSGARAGLGVYFEDNHPLNVSARVSGRQTNNSGEIQASTEAIKIAKENGVQKLCINTDSKFLIDSTTKWMPGWKENDWKLASGGDVKNKADFQKLDQQLNDNSIDVKWNHVKGHSGNYGNERADELARRGASKYNK